LLSSFRSPLENFFSLFLFFFPFPSLSIPFLASAFSIFSSAFSFLFFHHPPKFPQSVFLHSPPRVGFPISHFHFKQPPQAPFFPIHPTFLSSDFTLFFPFKNVVFFFHIPTRPPPRPVSLFSLPASANFSTVSQSYQPL